MKGVQAGGHLHRLHLVYRVAGGVEGTAKVQRRTAVGVVVFYHQILHLLSVHKGGREGVLRRLYVVVVFKTVSGQQLLYLLVRARCYLVYHRPGEGHLRLVGQILQKTLGHQTVVHPALGIGQHTGLHLVAVVRAVVHALHRQRKSTGLIALPQQGAHLAHGQHGSQTALQVGGGHTVTLLCDGERDHLQRRIAEYLHQTLPVSKLVVGLQSLGHRGNHFLLYRTGRLQTHQQRQVVVGGVGLVYHLIVEGLGHNHAAVVLSRVQRLVQYGGREGAEYVAAAEVYPCGGVVRLLSHGGPVEFRKLIALRFPFTGIILAGDNIT